MPRPQPLSFQDWSGGINKRLPSSSLADNELPDALNFELDERSQPRTRRGLTDISGNSTMSGCITSIYDYQLEDGSSRLLVSEGSSLWRGDMSNLATGWTDITGGLTFPTDTGWHWRTYEDWAIGTNGGDTSGGETTAVVVKGTAANAVALGGSPPDDAAFVEVLNNRVWIVPKNSNTLYWCKLGDSEDWTDTTATTGAGSMNVGGQEGSSITGLYALGGVLWVFKRNFIYYINVGEPNTDSDLFGYRRVSSKVGCLSCRTIQEVDNDLYFFSDYGVLRLSRAVENDDYRYTTISHKIPDLLTVNKNNDRCDLYASVVYPLRSQYWLAVPQESSSTENDVTWLVDYQRVDGQGERSLPWMKYSGGAVGCSYGIVADDNGTEQLLVGDSSGGLFRYGDDDVWDDDGTSYQKYILTKAYDSGLPLERKLHHHWGLEIGALADDVDIELTHRFEENDGKARTFDLNFEEVVVGGRFDTAGDVFDTAVFASSEDQDTDVLNRFGGSPGRKAQNVDFRIGSQDDTGFTVKLLKFWVSVLDGRRLVSDV